MAKAISEFSHMSPTPRYERIAGPQVVSGKIIDPWLVCAIDTGTFFARFVILNTGLPLKILVTGACGYKGTVLVPKLLSAGFEVVALDTMWFGNFLGPHECLTVIKGDVCQADSIDLKGIDAIIHLASIANDPCGDLEPKLTWEVSALATMRLADKAVRHGVKRFIYASSGSVYGVKEELQVTEDLELKPISDYNKTKMVAERVLLSYADLLNVQIVRPATVCGYSPRMRLDVSVNMLTMQALTKGTITVFGGKQVRPNIHIDDITEAGRMAHPVGSLAQYAASAH
jgi:nucleoside-diphosphate-sugar epimerase